MAKLENGKVALDHYGHIIWDWNGTLLDDIALCTEVNSALMVAHGMEPLTVERYQAIFGFPIEDYYRRLGFDFSVTPFAELADTYVAEYEARAPQMPLHSGVPETLQAIKAEGKLQSLLSAAHEGHVREMIDHYALSHHFDYVFGIENKHAASKIDRGHDLIAEAGIAPSETLMIGDTDHDHEVAEALGIDVVLVSAGHQSHERLLDRHHTVFERLEEVFG